MVPGLQIFRYYNPNLFDITSSYNSPEICLLYRECFCTGRTEFEESCLLRYHTYIIVSLRLLDPAPQSTKLSLTHHTISPKTVTYLFLHIVA
jgi:hypothetical protein